jgi:hypothetical protein
MPNPRRANRALRRLVYGRWIAPTGVLIVATLLCDPHPAGAQEPRTPTPPIHSGIYTTTLTAETLADLPLGDNVYAALETTQPELIADRFNSGGLNAGEGSRVGGFLTSPSQTLFRVGDVDISDPSGSGAALLFPDQLFWDRVDIWKAMMPPDLSTGGLAVVLEPRRPTRSWTTLIQGNGTGGSLVAPAPENAPPPVERLSNWGRGSLLLSGPIKQDRLGIVFGGSWTQSERFSRTPIPAGDSRLGSVFMNLVYTPSIETEWRTVAWVQRAHVPFVQRELFQPDASTTDQTLHLQSTWVRQTSGAQWRLFAGATARTRDNALGSSLSRAAERLLDGPIPTIVDATADASAARALGGVRFAAVAGQSGAHAVSAGLDLDYTLLKTTNSFSGVIGETVDGLPARAWSITPSPGESRRHAYTLSAFVGDHISARPGLSVDVALRVEAVRGSADGGENGIAWQNLLPRVALQWEFAQTKKIALVAGYRRTANRLNLDTLAYGDPLASTGIVSRWSVVTAAGLPNPASLGAIVDRIGPGTGGNAAFSRIDPELRRPVSDEWLVGIETTGDRWLRLGLTGLARRESNLMGVVDVGVPISSYTTSGIADPGLDFFDTADDQIVPVYNRIPATFGQNRYLLTNPDLPATYSGGLELNAQSSIDRLFMLFGATAYAALGSSGSRGFRALENDQDMLGELFTNPNAATFARGRLFTDRGFTIKWTTVYRFPGDVHAGVIARYQDGQPFSRFVIARDVNQGAELIRPYPNGDNRFTFTGTLDIRLQKGFRFGHSRVDAILDFYNLATRGNEVEEYVVTGPDFRTPTFIEPPHTIQLGFRVTF